MEAFMNTRTTINDFAKNKLGIGLLKDIPLAVDSAWGISFAVNTGAVFEFAFGQGNPAYELHAGAKVRLSGLPFYGSAALAYLFQTQSSDGQSDFGVLRSERISGNSITRNMYLVAALSIETCGFIGAIRTRFALDPATIRSDEYESGFHFIYYTKEPFFDSYAFMIGVKF